MLKDAGRGRRAGNSEPRWDAPAAGATGLKGLGEAERPLLPRAVAAPEWIQFGMGSVFETPNSSP